MKHIIITIILTLMTTLSPLSAYSAALTVPYSGTILDEGEAVEGTGYFKIAICTEDGTTLWSNDGTGTGCSEPSGSVEADLSSGVYSFMLGDTDLGMQSLTTDSLNTNETIYLRTWFGTDGSEFDQFSPDIRLGTTIRSGIADTLQGYGPEDFVLASEEISEDNIADGAVTSSKIDDGAVTASKISSFSNSGKTFTLGNDTDADVSLVANLSTTSPAITYVASEGVWKYSNDGVTFNTIATGSGSGDVTSVGSMGSGDAFADMTADDDWFGLGASAGRIEFDDQSTDEVNILNARVGVGTSTPSFQLHLHNTGASQATNAGAVFSLDTVSHPFTDLTSATGAGSLAVNDIDKGGIGLRGFSDTADSPGVTISGYIGSASPSTAAIKFSAQKSDGAADATALTGVEAALKVTNSTSDIMTLYGVGLLLTGGNGYDGKYSLYSEQGATDYTLIIQPNASMTQNVTYTLPADDGNSGQFMVSDGSGGLSWSSNAATATALAANPSDCAGGQYATSIDASGNLTCGAVSSGVATSDSPTWTGNHTHTVTQTSTGSLVDINATVGNDGDNDFVSALSIDVTTANTGDQDTLTGVWINATGSVDSNVNEYGLYISNDFDKQILMEDSMGGTVSINAPTFLGSGSYTLTLPTTDGSSGEYLQTDGSGVLSWASVSSGVAAGDSPTWTGTHVFQGKATFEKDPASGTAANASVVINPATSDANDYLLVVQDNGTNRFTVDKEGNSTVTQLLVGGDNPLTFTQDNLHVTKSNINGDSVYYPLALETMDSNSAATQWFGTGIRFYMENSQDGTPKDSLYIETAWQDATNASENSTFDIYQMIDGTNHTKTFGIDGSGAVQVGTGSNNVPLKGAKRQVSDKTSEYWLGGGDSNAVYTNAGAGGAVIFNLPTAEAGLVYTFVVMAAQNLDINADTGDQIVSLTNATGDAVRSATLYDNITLVAVDATNWVVTSSTGTWSDVN